MRKMNINNRKNIEKYCKYLKYKQKYLKLLKEFEKNSRIAPSEKYITYPFYKDHYVLTRSKFYQLVSEFKPKILKEVPKRLSSQKIQKYNNSYLIIEEDWDKNAELNNCTDYFTEECRIRCRFANHPSPLEYWNLHKDRLTELMEKKAEQYKIIFIRDTLYKETKLCNNFRISVALTVLKIFRARKWLDISAGWGDRLLAAIASDVELYCAADPNDCLHPQYRKMIEMLVAPEKWSNYILINDGFESAVLPKEKFDLVFSSPPFFDLEKYSTNTKDSLIQYQTSDSWYENFLLASIKKAYKYLLFDGHMVMYMDEGRGTNYIGRMIEDVSKFMKYEGIIYYYYPGNPKIRKLYVWCKN